MVPGRLVQLFFTLGGTNPLSAPLHLSCDKADVIEGLSQFPALARGKICRTREERNHIFSP